VSAELTRFGSRLRIVQEAQNAPDAAAPQAPPELPRQLVDLAPPVIIGTAVWALALAVVLVLQYGLDADVGFWPPTAIAGFGLGLLGLAIVGWQRKASRRGSRGAQRGL
jgi:hypothetical protein